MGDRVTVSDPKQGSGSGSAAPSGESRSTSHTGGGDVGLVETVGVGSGYEGFVEVRVACGVKEWHKTKDLVATDTPFKPNGTCKAHAILTIHQPHHCSLALQGC